MIFYALHQVANLLCIEEMERHLHQLDQKIRNQGNVNSGIHMQQYPAPDKVHAKLGDEKHELGDEDERDEAQVLSIDTPVNQRLGQEREHQLQQAAQQHPQQENHNLTTVGFEIFEKNPRLCL